MPSSTHAALNALDLKALPLSVNKFDRHAQAAVVGRRSAQERDGRRDAFVGVHLREADACMVIDGDEEELGLLEVTGGLAVSSLSSPVRMDHLPRRNNLLKLHT